MSLSQGHKPPQQRLCAERCCIKLSTTELPFLLFLFLRASERKKTFFYLNFRSTSGFLFLQLFLLFVCCRERSAGGSMSSSGSDADISGGQPEEPIEAVLSTESFDKLPPQESTNVNIDNMRSHMAKITSSTPSSPDASFRNNIFLDETKPSESQPPPLPKKLNRTSSCPGMSCNLQGRPHYNLIRADNKFYRSGQSYSSSCSPQAADRTFTPLAESRDTASFGNRGMPKSQNTKQGLRRANTDPSSVFSAQLSIEELSFSTLDGQLKAYFPDLGNRDKVCN
nr:PREDICTED: uncharacterized protein LOC106703086 [Latimeria chalumnae]|eukprot:XP_014342602.1 PREDICTED: uncharacterized protein LOC106703086 [Latimeria chalumnae]